MGAISFEEYESRKETLELMDIDPSGADDTVFGENRFVHCGSHGAVHITGWCTVPNIDKTPLETSTSDEGCFTSVNEECRDKSLWLYMDKEVV